MKPEWQTKTLDQISENLDSRRIPITKAVRNSGEYPYYGASGIVDYVAEYIFDCDALLVSEDGANLLARSTPIAFSVSGKYWVNNHAHILRFDQPETQRFVELYLESIPLDECITGAAQPKLNQKALNSIPIPLPPLSEQRRIVGILDEAFEGLATAKANAEQNLQNARALFESHLQAVFTQRGHGWIEKFLADICVVDWGNTDLTKSAYVDGGKFLAVSAAGCDGRIGHKEHARHTPVLSAIGAQCGKMFLPEEDFTAIKNTITLTPRNGTCSGKFLYRFLTHVELPKRGAAQPFISKGDIQTFPVVVPESPSVQNKIADSLDGLEEETQRLESLYQRKLAALDELKKSLLHRAFSGQL